MSPLSDAVFSSDGVRLIFAGQELRSRGRLWDGGHLGPVRARLPGGVRRIPLKVRTWLHARQQLTHTRSDEIERQNMLCSIGACLRC